MTSSSLRYHSATAVTRLPIRPLHLLLLASASSASVAWGWFLISGQQVGDIVKYLLLLGLYGAASTAFIFSRVKESHLRFFDIPVFLTVLMFVEFGLAPLECFVTPGQLNYNFDGNYGLLISALLYVALGMAAFWAGCATITGRARPRDGEAPVYRQENGRTQFRILQATIGIYAVAFAAKVYLLTHHLYAYLESQTAYFQHLASTQVLMVVSGFGTYALVIACIEKYLLPSNQKWRLLFWVLFTSECLWGLASGMKGALLQKFIVVALVSSLIGRRFDKKWVVATALVMIAFYPISNAYRVVVRGQHQTVTNFSAARKAGAEALTKTEQTSPGIGPELVRGFRSTVSRLDLLQSPALIISLGPDAGRILDNVHWWMLPFYPFVPRFIWRSKPVLLEGGRFSVALGYGGADSTAQTVGTSTAVTYPGDLYARGGLPAIILGMFVLGIVAQWLTNTVAGAVDRRRLFIYASIFLTVTDMEIDAFSFWSGFIKTFVILCIIAWLVYGPRPARRTAALKGVFARP